jgi:hypothetical protein
MPIIDDTTWLTARIQRTQDLIVKYEDAIDQLAGGAASYSLDTGQTRQTVTRNNLSSLRDVLSNLENRLSTLKARLNGAGVRSTPAW